VSNKNGLTLIIANLQSFQHNHRVIFTRSKMFALKSYPYVKIMNITNYLAFYYEIFYLYSVLASKFTCLESDCFQQRRSYRRFSMTTSRLQHSTSLRLLRKLKLPALAIRSWLRDELTWCRLYSKLRCVWLLPEKILSFFLKIPLYRTLSAVIVLNFLTSYRFSVQTVVNARRSLVGHAETL